MAASETNVDDEAKDWAEPSEQQAEQALSIGGRLGNWKTLASFALAVVLLAVAMGKSGIDPSRSWARLRTINLGLFAAAFAVYYLTFPLRGLRWKVLLQNAYERTHSTAVDNMSVRGLTEIIYISWFVNCVVPAKLGDLYRAYLAKLWVHISWTKTVGTVLAERIIDMLVLSLLLAGAGFLVFHDRLGKVSVILMLGFGLAIAGIVALLLMKTFGNTIRRAIPDRFVHRYVAFEEGTLDSFRRLPLLLALTASIWILEGGRWQLVFLSLGMNTHHISTIPFAPALFLALATAVLTTVPFTPGGLGLVEAGLLSLLIYLKIPSDAAVVLVLADRILSYLSIAVLGFFVYLLSKRSHFRHPV